MKPTPYKSMRFAEITAQALDTQKIVQDRGGKLVRVFASSLEHLIVISKDPLQKPGQADGLIVIVGEQDDGLRWHMSISHPRRYPTWDEQVEARYELMPNGLFMVSILPPEELYVNLHDNCFHWWEFRNGDDMTEEL